MRVDPETRLCTEHHVKACTICMLNDFHDELDVIKARRAKAKLEAIETAVHERFDLGGEG